MNKRNLIVRSLTRLIVISSFYLCLVLASRAETPKMAAHFIDVGQGHATLLEFPCGAVLIDTGAEEGYVSKLTDYLSYFFQRRSDLRSTLDLVIITHTHPDHTAGLLSVAQKFNIKRYIDNGQLRGPGSGNPNWMRTYAQSHTGVIVREVRGPSVPPPPQARGDTPVRTRV